MEGKRTAIFVLRLFIGGVLLATATGKFLDVPGFRAVLVTYQTFPLWIIAPVAWIMPSIELVLGLLLLFNQKLRLAALGSVALHLSFVALASSVLLRGLTLDNCGCFGVFLARPLTWGTVGEDLFMVALSASLTALAPRKS